MKCLHYHVFSVPKINYLLFHFFNADNEQIMKMTINLKACIFTERILKFQDKFCLTQDSTFLQ